MMEKTMWLNHLRFTVGVFVLVCLLTPAVLLLKLVVPDREPLSVYDSVVEAIEDLRDEIYFK
jgi:hypothetical protein